MAKHTYRTCDKCKQPIKEGWDDRLQDQIDREYLGKDICPNCDGDIKMSESIARQAAISGKKPGEVAQEWLRKYE